MRFINYARFVVRHVFIALPVLGMSIGNLAFADLEKIPSPIDDVRQTIKSGNFEGAVKLAKADIDKDGDIDTLMTVPSLSGSGGTSWFIYFKENGEYYHADESSIALGSGKMGAGELKEFGGNWGIVTYLKDSASTGVVHGVWFEKINEKEVKKHEKKIFRVNVGHKSETRKEDKAKIDEIFSRADEDVFDEVKHYTKEQFVEEHGLKGDEESENGSASEASDNDFSGNEVAE